MLGLGKLKSVSKLYRRGNNSKNATGYIYEKSLTKLNETPMKIILTEKAKAGTDIVAFHDGKRRWIAYQTWIEDEDDQENTKSEVQVICLEDEKVISKLPLPRSVVEL